VHRHQPTLHIVELGGRHDVFRLRFEQTLDILLGGANAVVRHRVGRENLGHRAGLLLFERLDLFEEVHKSRWIVPGLVHVLQAQHVGFGFKSAREGQEAHGNQNAGALINPVAGPAAHENERDGCQIGDLAARRLARTMARCHVGDLVRHYAGQFRFGIRFQNQPGVDEEESTRQGECIDILAVDHLNGERHLRIGIAHQILPNPVDILGDNRIVDDLGLPLHFLGELFAERDFFFDRVEVNAFTDVSIADLIGIQEGHGDR
jgi:hypothetical protein